MGKIANAAQATASFVTQEKTSCWLHNDTDKYARIVRFDGEFELPPGDTIG
jgi:hypothetical protein